MAKDGRSMTLEEIQAKLKDGSMEIVMETSGITKQVICTRCGSIHSPIFFLENPDPRDGFCSTCKTDKYLEWYDGDKKQDS